MTPAFALRKRPDAAFEALYRKHVHEIYRYALAVLGNPADAEDVTQTTFMNAYRAFHAGERPRKPHNWLRAIAHNVCRQRFRQAARRPSEVAALDELRLAAPEEPEGPSAEDIARALRSLPFNQRSALVMRELEGRSQVEIAAELDVSESAVEALLFRARRALREQLETSITCGEAARAISRQLDRSLPREERAALRAHVRECADCAAFARQARAQRGAIKKLAAVPLPASLLTWSGGGSAVGIGAKVAAGVAAAVVCAGAADVGIHQLTSKPQAQPKAAAAPKPARHAGVAVARGVPVSAAPSSRPATPRRGVTESHHAPGKTKAAPGAGAGRPRGHGAKPHAKPHRAHPNAVGTHPSAGQGRVKPRRPHAPHARPPKPPPSRGRGHQHAVVVKPPKPAKPPKPPKGSRTP